MINKCVNALDVPFKYEPWRKYKHAINIFRGRKKFFENKPNKRGSLICSKNCEINNFLGILELRAFYIEYK